MKKIVLIALLAMGVGQWAMAQPGRRAPRPKDEKAVQYASDITAADLKKHLSILAGDEFAGRGNGQEGLQKAAKYLISNFEQMGLEAVPPTQYYQTVPLWVAEKLEASLSVANKPYTFLEDFYCFNRTTTNLQHTTNEVVFAGYGIDEPNYNDYQKLLVQDKTVLVWQGEPMTTDSVYRVNNTKTPSAWTTDWRKKSETAKRKGIKTLLIVTTEIPVKVRQFGNYINGEGMMQLAADVNNQNTTERITNVVYISEAIAKNILGENYKNCMAALKKGKPRPKTIATKPLQLTIEKKGQAVEVGNIPALIRGSELPDEYIVLTAHYDHLGIEHGETYYGADDDGSGTAALLEMAQAFGLAAAKGDRPRRSILIMPVAGEEKGLLGSRYFTDIEPLVPLHQIVADLNTDMIGRIDDQHKDGNYLYIIGDDKLSSDLRRISEEMNETYTQLELDYRYNDENDPNRFYYRSDHYNFAKNNIPVAFYFNGTHPDYHKPTDTVDKIDFEAMQNRTRLIFYTAWELANRKNRIVVDSHKK